MSPAGDKEARVRARLEAAVAMAIALLDQLNAEGEGLEDDEREDDREAA